MNKPSVYVKFNALQKNDASFVLSNYLRYIRWTNEESESVFEIGCGPGDISKEILMPLLPNNIRELVCIDKSEEMINFAKKNSSHEKIQYIQMDICSDDAVRILGRNKFDHVFSFYCLHWVQHQRKTYQTIYDVLKPGGDALILLIVSHPMYDVCNSLALKEKYRPYLKETNKLISPYSTSKYPKKDLEDILSDTGFHICICEYKLMDFVVPNESYMKGFALSTDPFMDSMPTNVRKDYLDELVDNFEKKKTNNNTISYSILIACMRKPKEDKTFK